MKIKKRTPRTTNIDEDVGKKEYSYTTVANVN
jgi:hypothetical protein